MSGYSKIESASQRSEHVIADLQTQKPKIESEPKTEATEVSEAREPRLSRNRSVASSGHAVKRAISMRRSSSVSERYCRIHDQDSATWPFPFQEEADDEEEDEEENKEEKKKEKKKKKTTRSKFLKACKRFFGIS